MKPLLKPLPIKLGFYTKSLGKVSNSQQPSEREPVQWQVVTSPGFKSLAQREIIVNRYFLILKETRGLHILDK
jgi:hypothetical protein